MGDLLKIRAQDVGLGDMALVEMPDGAQSLAQAIELDGDQVSLQVFGGGKGLSTQATARFLGHPTQVTYSPTTDHSAGCAWGVGLPFDFLCVLSRSV